MKLKKQIVRKKSESPNLDTFDDFHDDELCSNDGKELPIQRNTANARERARMRVLSSAFYRLKTIIPWVPHDTKLSKLDTLRLARNYISYLSATLEGQPVNEITNKMPHPQKMTWPYIFQQVPDLNANKISSSSSPASSSSFKENTRKNNTTSENFNKYNSYDETLMTSYSPNFNPKCNDDFEFMN